MTLHNLGWKEHYAEHLRGPEGESLEAGRVVRMEREYYRVVTAQGEFTAQITGKLKHRARSKADFPVVGDWVGCSVEAGGELARIHKVLPRGSKISRKTKGSTTEEQVLAANIDTVFLTMGLDNDFNLRRLERSLTLVWESGAVPVVVLNKLDLEPEYMEYLQQVEAVAPGVGVHVVSAADGENVEELREYLKPAQTSVFLGSSGVGKSSLVNRLAGDEVMKTGRVRTGDDKGRHTTTHRELVILPGDSMLIDTPGLRELQLWGEGEGLKDSFADIEELAEHCRFRDCTHFNEPGCAVLKALKSGELDKGRYTSWSKLQKELQFLAEKQDEASRGNRKRRWKNISKLVKQYNAIRDKD